MRKYWGKIAGCAGGWFFFDITFYGNSLFQATILKQVFKTNTTNAAEAPVTGGLDHNLCVQMILIGLIGLPGYYISVWQMDRLGRRFIQMQGFFMMAVIFALLGALYHTLEESEGGRVLMLLLYGLTFFFSNFGPNSTTFILPSETFPAHIRSTLNGFSAACGKAGAVLGSSTFKPLADKSLTATLLICSSISVIGLVITFFFVEDLREKSIDEEEVDDGPNNSSSDAVWGVGSTTTR